MTSAGGDGPLLDLRRASSIVCALVAETTCLWLEVDPMLSSDSYFEKPGVEGATDGIEDVCSGVSPTCLN